MDARVLEKILNLKYGCKITDDLICLTEGVDATARFMKSGMGH
jgi:hypothetical protein